MSRPLPSPALPRAAALAALPWLFASCGGEAGPAPTASVFVERAAQAGIEFVHDNGFRNSYAFPETMGSGAALLDLDGDGDLDLYAVQGGVVPDSTAASLESGARPTNELYLGDGQGQFERATERAGDAAHDGCGMGVCGGDVDGDGSLDLFVTNFGPDVLLLNDGAARFRAAAGEVVGDAGWNTAAGFADFDRDGALDLLVVGYVALEDQLYSGCFKEGLPDYCDVAIFDGAPDHLYRGDGRGGFVDVTREWGFEGARGKGLGLALVDCDDDGDVDAYIANDSVANELWLNQGDGRMLDHTDASGAARNVDGKPEAGMGVGVADLNQDQRPDFLVTNFTGESNTLYVSGANARYRDRSRPSGLTVHSRQPLGFGTAFADFDLDGIDDLFVTNGHVLRNLGDTQAIYTYRQSDQLFRGLGRAKFELWEAGEDVAAPSVGRGVVVGDVDGDGDPDLVTTNSGEALRLFENRAPELGAATPAARYLVVELRGKGSNTFAVGARVTLELEGEQPSQTRWIRSGTAYLCQDELVARFGVPAGPGSGELAVIWPDGSASRHAVDAFDQRLRVQQP